MSLSLTHPSKVLVIAIAHIGDLVLATPLVRGLRTFFPLAAIDILASRINQEAAKHNPYIDNIFIYDVKDWQKDRLQLLSLIQQLQNREYDLAISLSYGTCDAMLAWLSGAKYRLGYSNNISDKFLTHSINMPNYLIHESQKHLKFLEALNISYYDTNIEFLVSSEEEISLLNKMPQINSKPYAVMCPFSSHPNKNWTIQAWRNLVSYLSPFTSCIFIGSEKNIAEIKLITNELDNTFIAAGLLTLGEAAALIKTATVFITVDTGPLHIAQAFATPVIALMGPTHEKVWGPRNNFDIVIRADNCQLAPCWQYYANYPQIICSNNICMTCIDSLKIIEAINSIFKSKMNK